MKLSAPVLLATFALVVGCIGSSPTEDVGRATAPLVEVFDRCDTVLRSETMVRVAEGVELHVIEKHTPRGLAAAPRRALLMLPPTLATNAIYDAQVPGDSSGDFDALERAARKGYLAFAPSYEGYGASTHPADGATVTKARSLADVAALIQWIHKTHAVEQVDVFGMSIGSSLAVALGSTTSAVRAHVGRIVVTSNVYASVTPFFASAFFNPGLYAFLQSAPNGYVTTTPEAYGLLLSNSEPAAVTWLNSALPGTYATGPTLEGFTLPLFDASLGRAPMLQVWGTADPVTPPEDVAAFQAAYGGPKALRVIEGGAHSLPFEPGREALWSSTFEFLDDGRPSIREVACPE